MPVGKNALKRVTNNGYSKVAVSAPDMEHSEVVESKEAPKREEFSVKTEAKRNTAPKTKKESKPKPSVKKVEAVKRPDGFVRYEFGAELPVHLL